MVDSFQRRRANKAPAVGPEAFDGGDNDGPIAPWATGGNADTGFRSTVSELRDQGHYSPCNCGRQPVPAGPG